ncbi:MAG TPA: hypothetical protein QGI03_16250 [Dehalococcoidia bacterium]|jgi:hypothetical protein|nr:hypothetical protein [Dehalococcoidia bacterium]|tara:strand:+ start:1215 stop:3035 length:1821 start_codon:yes stop_codon:yes gene_type:complete
MPDGQMQRESDILEKFYRAKAKCSKWHSRIKEYERFYDLEHYNDSPRTGERRITLTKGTNIVDLAVGVLTANELTIQAVSPEESETIRKQASLVEQFLDGVIYINSERQETDLRYDWTFYQVRDGAVGLKTIWDNSFDASLKVEADEEGNQRAVYDQLPICVNVLPAKYLFPEPGGKLGRWKYVFYAIERTIEDMEREYGPMEKYNSMSKKQKETKKGDFIDYWGEVQLPDGSWAIENATLYDNRLMDGPRIMDGYNDIPITMMFYKPIGHVNPEDWGHSILRPVTQMVEELEWRVNRQTRLLNVFANMPLIARTRDGRPVKVDAAFGDVVQLNEGEDIAFPVWPGTPPDFKEQLAMVSSEIADASFPAVMYGEGTGSGSGYALSQQGDAGRIRLTQPQRQQERSMSIWARKSLTLLRNFSPQYTVEVYGDKAGAPYSQELTGEDTVGFRVNFQLKPQFPNDEVRKVAMATQTKDTLSAETRMEKYLGIQQPDQETTKILRDMARRHPMMVEYQMTSLFRELAEEGDPAAAAVLQKLEAGGQPGGGGPPGPAPGGPKPEQSPGLPTSRRGEVTQQERGLAPPGQEPSEEVFRVAQAMGGVPMTGGA